MASEEQQEFLHALRFYRRAEKLLSTYIRKFAPDAGVVKDGYVYPDYNSHGTVTGRLSSSNPNFQNIPVIDELAKKTCSISINECPDSVAVSGRSGFKWSKLERYCR